MVLNKKLVDTISKGSSLSACNCA